MDLVTQDLLIYHELFHFYYHLQPNKGKRINVSNFAGIQTRHAGSERECCNHNTDGFILERMEPVRKKKKKKRKKKKKKKRKKSQ